MAAAVVSFTIANILSNCYNTINITSIHRDEEEAV